MLFWGTRMRGWVSEVRAGDTVLREGDPAEAFILLLSGEIRVQEAERFVEARA